ncbi:MaoC/PaaZ C-terminal domain-containing protein [Lipingzhangella sp. LS1_29]|uniref:MaoC/PaaZ C-terminal domain-containing protein n=1 Tax=Lipingzhangella rawalii TaxID=2055835 RepID=A0ABU2HBN0_9ACTN|nr:MaoC/PaaZ C-terminal domain-containing protein [Lipingzhangella rawalii]MDS1272220.1 MaoC/PaaZ C-terminal domain-containing protein [Lipingzhangella rawalii]
MSDPQLTFDASALGAWTPQRRFTVTQQHLISYAKATNDPIPAHRNGDVASPVFAIVPVFETLLEPVMAVVPESLLGQVVHSQQDFRFHRALRPGDELTVRGTMLGYAPRRSGTAATAYLESRDPHGTLVNEQYVTFVVRGFDAGHSAGETAPDHRLPAELREQPPRAMTTQQVDKDQTFRYAPAAGDHMAIHLDDEVARQVGLPGIILHGLCTMAFSSWAALTELADSDVRRLRRLAVRFSAPVLPGQQLHTRFWDASGDGEHPRYAFETNTNNGDTTVLKDGLAEFDTDTHTPT